MLFRNLIGGGGNLPRLTALSVTSAIGTSITAPSGIEAGDLLFAAATARESAMFSTPSIPIVYGTGFTGINYMDNTGAWSLTIGQPPNQTTTTYYTRQVTIVSYKIANGTESNTTLGGFPDSPTRDERVVLFHIRGAKPIVSITSNAIATSATNGDPPLYTINSNASFDEVVYHAGTYPFFNSDVVTNIEPDLKYYFYSDAYTSMSSGIWTSRQKASSYTFDAPDGTTDQTSAGFTYYNHPFGGTLRLTY